MSNTTNKIFKEITILYEDANCVVVNKPAGLMVHSDGRDEGPFLTDWVLKTYPKSKNVGEPSRALDGTDIDRSGIVHRLDRETSGAIIIAKNQKGYESLKSQFQEKEVLKKYLAFVWGEERENFGTIDRPIGRSANDFRKWSAQRGARGELRPAETYWVRVWTGILPDSIEKVSLILCEPKTGRTHQIRVHMNAVNHPVIGDSLYAPKRPNVLGFLRTALHSCYIEFDNLRGERIKVQVPLPKDFTKALNILDVDLKLL